MTANQTWRAARLEQLRRMLCRVIDEREAINAIDPVKAAHLGDAAVDLQTLINRIEDDADDESPAGPVSTAEPRQEQTGQVRPLKETLDTARATQVQRGPARIANCKEVDMPLR